MHLQQAEQELNQQLTTVYDGAEAAAISNLVMNHLTGMDRMKRRLAGEQPLAAALENRLGEMTTQLLQHKPVQYVIGKAWFYNMELLVNEAVLIPRPETEELVHWILEKEGSRTKAAILDIGTGSGCIPIAIKKNWPEASVFGVDVSEAALAVAAENSGQQKVAIKYSLCNMLDESQWPSGQFDIIVSNPPYIPLQESGLLDKNVTAWEPHLALFVPDNDPLLFYRRIGEFALQHLEKGGSLYFECHQQYARQVLEMLQQNGFLAEMKLDLFGNERMIQAKIKSH